MLRTIQIGTCMLVQGPVVRTYDDGRVAIRIADRTYVGVPVERPLPRAA
jgi:hypothetical protein